MTTEEEALSRIQQHLDAAAAAVEAELEGIPDLVARQAAARAAAEMIPSVTHSVAVVRGRALQAIKEDAAGRKMTNNAVAAMAGDLSGTRVQQLIALAKQPKKTEEK
ncbi:hypothetical protein [Streptomyces jumonjinensis]|uniref:hypothetical protein n=1 Tax=Streptomyces jumonjinensis TaxID=1945 RepID=UPI0037A06780